MKKVALIVAGGKGTRFKNSIPKQFISVNNKLILEYSLEVFRPLVDLIMIAVSDDYVHFIDHLKSDSIHICSAGNSRQESVLNGLKSLAIHNPDLVAIHDSARPLVSKQMVEDSFTKAKEYGSAIPTISIQDSLWYFEEDLLIKPCDRNNIKASQTPQTFDFNRIYQAHQQQNNLETFSDCASVYLTKFDSLNYYEGHKKNLKITTPEDIDLFTFYLK